MGQLRAIIGDGMRYGGCRIATAYYLQNETPSLFATHFISFSRPPRKQTGTCQSGPFSESGEACLHPCNPT